MERKEESTLYTRAISFNAGLLSGLYPEIDIEIKDALDTFLTTIDSAIGQINETP